MTTRTLATIPQTWIGKPIVLLDNTGQPWISGRLAMHTLSNCDSRGVPQLAHIVLKIRDDMQPAEIKHLDAGTAVRLSTDSQTTAKENR